MVVLGAERDPGAAAAYAADTPDPILPRPRWITWLAERPRIADMFVILVCTATPTAALIINAPEHAWWGYVCAAGVGIAFWWRRSHPMLVLVVVVALASLNPVAAVTFAPALYERCFALYTLATQRRLRTAVLGFFIGEAVMIAASVLGMLLGLRERWPTIGLQASVLAALAIGVAVRASRARRAALAGLVAEREERAAAAERARITAEMHDVVAHSVTVMVALAGGASAGWEKHPERARSALDQLGVVGARALQEMQRILRVLRDHDGELDRNLEASGHNLPSLEDLIDLFRAAGLPAELSPTSAEAIAAIAAADLALHTSVYRVVQESLTNALRHARVATAVEVDVAVQGAGRTGRDLTRGIVTATITDNGGPLDSYTGAGPIAVPSSGSPTGAGVGLAAMRERAAAFGGVLEAGPILSRVDAPGTGWRTRVTWPLNGGRSA